METAGSLFRTRQNTQVEVSRTTGAAGASPVLSAETQSRPSPGWVIQQGRTAAGRGPARSVPTALQGAGGPQALPCESLPGPGPPRKQWFSAQTGESHRAALETANHSPITTAILGGSLSEPPAQQISGRTGHLYYLEASRCLSHKLQPVYPPE